MATSITLTTNTASITECSLTTNAASTEYTLASGWRGPAGATGPAGASATVDQMIIDGSANAVAGNAVFDALALKSPLASPTFTGTVTATGAVNTGARVTATRGTVGVGTVYTNLSLTDIAGTSTDFLSRFVVGDSITVNTTAGSETRVITAIASDTSMTTLPFSGPSASGAEAYTHTAASAVMNPSGAITGRTGTFSGAVSGTTGFFTGAVSVSGLTITNTPLPIASGGTGGATASAARTALGSKAIGDALFQANTVGEAMSILGKTIIVKQTSEPRSNTTILANDAELTGYSMAANTCYVVRFLIFISAASGAGKLSFLVPSLATGQTNGWGYVLHSGISAPSGITRASATELQAISFSGIGNGLWSGQIIIRTGATAGNFALQWAQATLNASPMTIAAGSFLEIDKIT